MPFSVPSTLDKHMRKCEKNPQYHHNLQNQSNENLLDLNNNNNNVVSHKKVNHVKKEKTKATTTVPTPVLASNKNAMKNSDNLPAGIQFNQVDNDDEQDFNDQYQDEMNYDEDEPLHEAEIDGAVEDGDDEDNLDEMYDENDDMLREHDMLKEELENDYDDEENENGNDDDDDDLDSAPIQPQTVNQLANNNNNNNNNTSSAQRSVNRRKLNMSSRKQYNRNQQVVEMLDENNNMDDLNGSAHLNSAGDDDEELDETGEETGEMV